MDSSSTTHQPESAFLTLPRAAAYLGISANTLYVWRHRRQGPPSFRMGRRRHVQDLRTRGVGGPAGRGRFSVQSRLESAEPETAEAHTVTPSTSQSNDAQPTPYSRPTPGSDLPGRSVPHTVLIGTAHSGRQETGKRERTSLWGKGMRYRVKGIPGVQDRSFETGDDAKRWLATAQADSNRGEFIDPRDGEITLADYIEDHWWPSRTDEPSTARTRLRYSSPRSSRSAAVRPA